MTTINYHAGMRPFIGIASCWALLCGFTGIIVRAADNQTPTTPAATLTAVSKALGEGDVATLATLVSGDEKQKAWIAAYAAQLRAFHELDQAFARKYTRDYTDGDLGREIREQIDTAKDMDLIRDLKEAKLGKPDGETMLVILDEAASDDRNGRLVKVDGKWKLELGSLANYFSIDDTAGLRAMAEAAAGLKRDVDAGKLTSLADTAKAVEERLTAAVEIGAKKPAVNSIKAK